MSGCISNNQCPKGFCNYGVCSTPMNPGDPCKPRGCLGSLVCHSLLSRCVEPGYNRSGWFTKKCSGDDFCLSSEFCISGKCVRGKRNDESCGTFGPCENGLECFKGKCVKRCLGDRNCGIEMTCQHVGGSRYKLCIPNRKFKPNQTKEPKPQPQPQPQFSEPPPPVVDRPSGSSTSDLFTLRNMLFMGVTLVILIVIAVLLFKKFRKSKTPTAMLPQLQTYYYPPSPSSPSNYGVVSADAPPGYVDERPGITGAGTEATNQYTDEKSSKQ